MKTEIARFFEYGLQLNEPPEGDATWQIVKGEQIVEEGGPEIVVRFCDMAKGM